MLVICIDESKNRNPAVHPVVFGKEYNITGVVPGFEETHVTIAEHPLSKNGFLAAYNRDSFAEVSDLDETTLVTEEFEEKYCVPVNI
jgi:hypothetical protein